MKIPLPATDAAKHFGCICEYKGHGFNTIHSSCPMHMGWVLVGDDLHHTTLGEYEGWQGSGDTLYTTDMADIALTRTEDSEDPHQWDEWNVIEWDDQPEGE